MLPEPDAESLMKKYYDVKVGTQFGTQKCATLAVEAVNAVHAVRNLLNKFSAC
jgi:hypothetical protein